MKIRFRRSQYDTCVYIKQEGGVSDVCMLLYVDDILVASQDKNEIQKLKDSLSIEFKMKDLRNAKKILGMNIIRRRKKKKLILSQKTYLKKMLHRFNMLESKAVGTLLGQHFKLSSDQAPQSDEEKAMM